MIDLIPTSARYRHLMLRQVHDFYRYPADYLDSSWLSEDPHWGAIERLWRRPHSRKVMSDYILQRCGLAKTMDCDFAASYQRLPLLAGDALQRMIMLGGALAYSARIPKRAEAVAASTELHRFAVSKAPFLARNAPAFCIDLGIADWMDQEAVSQGLRSAGLNMLACALNGVPQSVVKRLALKLPHAYSAMCDAAFIRQATPEQIQEAQRLMLKLYREVDPSCSLLFD
ncbi:hypothetical protein HCH_05121 [Hahella chejuensis KCTC 2396]|uniref:Uncharacterized protein n=1 Tax=Hahella chejuensis (strain KCTC 2396) TaxID=349521 RepID=Q2SC23_HAHCH|nr:SctK family type III secretion system sorting platform protein [Hahella chejuensis]ABC31801.1 hypothetical protein HCH_05121 [Hahella chejuensis KCTC 2396]